jgi:RNA polymerase sigma-70 factor, ECF subfamily
MELREDRFRRLIEPLHDRVLGFARSLCRSTPGGDDLFQDALLRAYRKLDGLRDDAAFRPWLYRIVVTMHRSHCRRASFRRLVLIRDERSDENETLFRNEAWAPDAVEAQRRARTALAQLGAAQREAIVLYEIEGFTVDEIATIQAVSASAVKSRLARGRERLRAIYEAAALPVPALQGGS